MTTFIRDLQRLADYRLGINHEPPAEASPCLGLPRAFAHDLDGDEVCDPGIHHAPPYCWESRDFLGSVSIPRRT